LNPGQARETGIVETGELGGLPVDFVVPAPSVLRKEPEYWGSPYTRQTLGPSPFPRSLEGIQFSGFQRIEIPAKEKKEFAQKKEGGGPVEDSPRQCFGKESGSTFLALLNTLLARNLTDRKEAH